MADPDWLDRDDWRLTQQSLHQRNFYPYRIDGVPGEKTCDAVDAALARLDELEGMVGEADTSPTLKPAPPWPPEGKYRFSKQSLERMAGVHPDLRAVAHYAIRVTNVDFGITRTGGVRTLDLQRELLAQGVSKTLRSRHLTGHALDFYAVVNGQVTWKTAPVLQVHDAFVAAGKALGVRLRWGGDWDMDGQRERGENDLVHHELPRGVYGDDPNSRSPAAAAFLEHVG